MTRSLLTASVALTLTLSPALAPAQQTPIQDDKGFLTNLIEKNLSDVTRSVDIQGFEGALSSRATIDSLTISDRDGAWLVMEDLVIAWNRGRLLTGRIEIEEMAAGRIAYLRAPTADPSVPSPEAKPFRLPELPVAVQIDKLDAARIELDESLLGEPLALSVDGAVVLQGGALDTAITATRLDGKQGRFAVNAFFDNSSRVLGLLLDAQEGPGGLAAQKLDLPGAPSVRLNIAGEAPIDDYTAQISLATDGQERLAGEVTLSRALDEDPNDDLPPEESFALNLGGDVTALFAPDYRDFFGPDMRLVASGARHADGSLSLKALDLKARAMTLTGAAEIGADGWPQSFALSGGLASTDGEPVLLPLSGPRTYVSGGVLDLSFDSAKGDEWTALFDLRNVDRPDMDIAELRLEGGGEIARGDGGAFGQWTAALDYAASGLALEDHNLAQALGDEISGVLVAAGREGRPTRLKRFTLTGPGLEAEGDATIGGATARLPAKLRLSLKAAELGRFSGIAGQEISGSADLKIGLDGKLLDRSFELDISGQTDDLALGQEQMDALLGGSGELLFKGGRDAKGTRIDTLELTTAQARITAEAEVTSGPTTADFVALIKDTSVLSADLTGEARITGKVRRDETGAGTAEILASAPDATLDLIARSPSEADGGPIGLTGDLTLTDLERYAELIGRGLGGAAEVKLSGALQPKDGALNLLLTAQTDDLAIGQEQADALLAGDGQLDVQLAREATGALHLRDLRMTTDAMRAQGNARLHQGAVTADIDARISDASRLDPGLLGEMRLIGTARQNAQGRSDIDLRATAPGATLDLDALIAPKDQGGAAEFTARANLERLSQYAGLIGRPLRGGLDATLSGTASPEDKSFDVALNGTTRNLAIGQDVVDGLLRGTGTVSLDAARAADGDIDLRGFAFDSASTTARASGQFENGQITGSAQARVADSSVLARGLSGPTALQAEASPSGDGQTAVAVTAQAPGATADVKATIAAPAEQFRTAFTGTAQIANLAAYRRLIGQPVSGGLSLTTSGSALPKAGAFSAQIDGSTQNIGISNLTADTLLAGAGRITGTITRSAAGAIRVEGLNASFPNASLSGNLDAAAGSSAGSANFTARLRDIGLLTNELSGPLTATGSATARGGAWALDISAQGPAASTAQVSGQLVPSGSSDLAISGQIPLGLANKRLAPRSIDGTAALDLRLNGPLALSSLRGTIRTDGTRLSIPRIGEAISDISGEVRLTGGAADIALSGALSEGGTVAVDGPVQIVPQPTGTLNVTLREVVIKDPQLFRTRANGQLTVAGPLDGGALISGTVMLDETEVRVPSSAIGNLGPLPEVKHIGAPAGVAQTLNRAGLTVAGVKLGRVGDGQGGTRQARPFPLDLTITAPSRIFVRGRGLDAELGGQLRIGGDTKQVIPSGRFELVRGRINILQQRFELTEGYATLQGDFNPYLRLVAETETDDGLVSIILDGPASEPEITFESSPELPQDEILSRLIFGRDLSSISPLQAVQLAAAVNTLAGRGNGGLVNRLRENVGLDDLDVTTSEEGNTQLKAGKYISENIYTDVTVDSEGTSEINLNLDLTDSLTVRGSTSNKGESSLGLFFEKDY